MAATIDLTDIPAVAARDLMLPMQILISRGRGLALLDGVDEPTLRELEDHVWRTLDADSATKLAVVLRFRNLLHVFTGRRLQGLFLETGFAIIAPAIATAANMRLNTKWGFSVHKFHAALRRARHPGRDRTERATTERLAA